MKSSSSRVDLSFPVGVYVLPEVDKREMFPQEVQVSASVRHQG